MHVVVKIDLLAGGRFVYQHNYTCTSQLMGNLETASRFAIHLNNYGNTKTVSKQLQNFRPLHKH